MENIPDYIKRKHNNSLTVYQHPMLEPVLKETFGMNDLSRTSDGSCKYFSRIFSSKS